MKGITLLKHRSTTTASSQHVSLFLFFKNHIEYKIGAVYTRVYQRTTIEHIHCLITDQLTDTAIEGTPLFNRYKHCTMLLSHPLRIDIY
jgi:hypothetical protein